MRLTDPRVLTTLVLGMLFTGVFAFAVYTASLDDSVFQAPTIKADAFYVGGDTLATYIASVAPGGGGGATAGTGYVIYWNATSSTWDARNQQTGVIDESNADPAIVITNCLANRPGKIVLSAGTTYAFASTVTLPSSLSGYGSIIEGESDAVLITSSEAKVFDGNATSWVGGTMNPSKFTLRNLRIQHNTIDANSITIDGWWTYLFLENVRIDNTDAKSTGHRCKVRTQARRRSGVVQWDTVFVSDYDTNYWLEADHVQYNNLASFTAETDGYYISTCGWVTFVNPWYQFQIGGYGGRVALRRRGVLRYLFGTAMENVASSPGSGYIFHLTGGGGVQVFGLGPTVAG